MPIETFGFVADLNALYPPHTDPLGEADSHLRGIKHTLKSTFPALDAAVTDTPADLNGTAGRTPGTGLFRVEAQSTTVGGAIILKAPTTGSHPDLKLQNDGGALGVYAWDGTTWNAAASLTYDGNATVAGWLTAQALKQAGNALLPAGCIITWSGSIASIPAGWHLCDGTSGTPDLRDKFIAGAGSTYAVAAAGGSATLSVTTASAGSHSHGTATAAGGAYTGSPSTSSAGSHSHGGGVGSHSLSVAELPAHAHGAIGTFTGYNSGYQYGPDANIAPKWAVNKGDSDYVGSGAGHTHTVSTDGGHTHTVALSLPDHTHAINADGTHSHTVSGAALPPYYALAFIMKL